MSRSETVCVNGFSHSWYPWERAPDGMFFKTGYSYYSECSIFGCSMKRFAVELVHVGKYEEREKHDEPPKLDEEP
jgi:hypothetical protein